AAWQPSAEVGPHSSEEVGGQGWEAVSVSGRSEQTLKIADLGDGCQIDLYAFAGSLPCVVPPGLVHSGQNVVFGAILEVQPEIEQTVVDAGLLRNGLLDPPGVTHDRLQAQSCGVGAIRGEVTEVSCCRLAKTCSHRRIVPAVKTDIGEHADTDDVLCFEIGAQCRELLADVRVVPVDQRAVGDEGEALCRTGDPAVADDRD